MASQASKGGRFEQSFMFHMIKDFFLLLLVVAVVEMAIRYVALRYDFASREPARVRGAAEQLANDVRSIMLNAGGPTAAQTVYPILNRNYDDLGLSIAVLPTDVTVASMKATRNMDVQGLQARWAQGDHQQASVSLSAEQYCLGCHVLAKVGEVLGTVQVRSYLERKEALWWQEVRLTAGALSVKILIHTIVLFLLLKVRMEPLLALRGTVSGLAKGVMDLSPRASVKSHDEFGELAEDLNHFLDRIASLVGDLDRILSEVVDVGTRVGSLNKDLEGQLDNLRDGTLQRLGQGARHGLDRQLVVAREAGAFSALLQTLDTLAAAGGAPAERSAAMRTQLDRLRDSFGAVADAARDLAPPSALNETQAEQYQAFAMSLREMALLEAKMQNVAESGRQVLQRLTAGRPVSGAVA